MLDFFEFIYFFPPSQNAPDYVSSPSPYYWYSPSSLSNVISAEIAACLSLSYKQIIRYHMDNLHRGAYFVTPRRMRNSLIAWTDLIFIDGCVRTLNWTLVREDEEVSEGGYRGIFTSWRHRKYRLYLLLQHAHERRCRSDLNAKSIKNQKRIWERVSDWLIIQSIYVFKYYYKKSSLKIIYFLCIAENCYYCLFFKDSKETAFGLMFSNIP